MDPTYLIFGIIAILIYFIPAMLSVNKKNGTGITLLNLFLGWTFLGWVGALIWAVCSDYLPESKHSKNNQ